MLPKKVLTANFARGSSVRAEVCRRRSAWRAFVHTSAELVATLVCQETVGSRQVRCYCWSSLSQPLNPKQKLSASIPLSLSGLPKGRQKQVQYSRFLTAKGTYRPVSLQSDAPSTDAPPTLAARLEPNLCGRNVEGSELLEQDRCSIALAESFGANI